MDNRFESKIGPVRVQICLTHAEQRRAVGFQHLEKERY